MTNSLPLAQIPVASRPPSSSVADRFSGSCNLRGPARGGRQTVDSLPLNYEELFPLMRNLDFSNYFTWCKMSGNVPSSVLSCSCNCRVPGTSYMAVQICTKCKHVVKQYPSKVRQRSLPVAVTTKPGAHHQVNLCTITSSSILLSSCDNQL